MSYRFALVTGLLLAAVHVSAQPAPTKLGPVTIQKLTNPKALQWDVQVPGSRSEVWKAMTTAEGMKSWIAPDARVQLREGGEWLAIWSGAAPGGGKIQSFSNESKLVIHAMAPERFPEVRSVGTTVTFTLESCGAQCTRVRMLQTGWKAGAEWDAAYDYLAGGNAQVLESLHRRFADETVKPK